MAIRCFYYMIVRLVDAKLFYVKNLEGSFCTDLWRSGGGVTHVNPYVPISDLHIFDKTVGTTFFFEAQRKSFLKV